jgi:hypothetical protein
MSAREWHKCPICKKKKSLYVKISEEQKHSVRDDCELYFKDDSFMVLVRCRCDICGTSWIADIEILKGRDEK